MALFDLMCSQIVFGGISWPGLALALDHGFVTAFTMIDTCN